MKRKIITVLLIFSLAVTSFAGVRIKDIARIQSGPEDQLTGYGLVVGLNGTGDKGKTVFTPQSIANMLQRMGITVPPDKLKVKNVAAVIVTARLSSFAKAGGRIDVTASSLGDADSLKGGTLLITPLKGIDGKVYATAEGPVQVGPAAGKGTVQTSGRLAGGGLLLADAGRTGWLQADEDTRFFFLALEQPDFTTARRVADSLNDQYTGVAAAVDPGLVRVNVPDTVNPVEFAADVEGVDVEPDAKARVVINERTGTVVMGQSVAISPVAVSHGSLSLEIGSQGKARKNRSSVMVEGSSVEEVARALNTLGVTPRDIIDIFQAIKRAGALQAELEIM